MVAYPPDPGTTVAERTLRMVTALSAEVAVLRERLAVLESVAEQKGVLTVAELDEYRPAAAQAMAFRAARLGLIDRVFRALKA